MYHSKRLGIGASCMKNSYYVAPLYVPSVSGMTPFCNYETRRLLNVTKKYNQLLQSLTTSSYVQLFTNQFPTRTTVFYVVTSS